MQITKYYTKNLPPKSLNKNSCLGRPNCIPLGWYRVMVAILFLGTSMVCELAGAVIPKSNEQIQNRNKETIKSELPTQSFIF